MRDHVEPVQGGLVGDLLAVALVGEGAVGDLNGEVLGDLVFVDHAPGALADRSAGIRGTQGSAGSGDHRLDLVELGFGSGEQLCAFAGSLSRDGGVAAHHESFGGERGGGDLSEVLLVEERQLQLA